MRTSANSRTPVVIASATLLPATRASPTAPARSTATRASGWSRTGRCSTATSRTCSRVRSLPLMWRACKGVSSFWCGVSDLPGRSKARPHTAHGLTKRTHILFRNQSPVQVLIGYDMSRFCLGQKRSITHPHGLVFETHHRLADVFQMRANDDLVIIPGRCFVPAARIHHGDVAAVFAFHLAIREPELPQQFYASNFKPDEIIRVIHHAHLVGFRVTHPHPAL